MAEAMRVEIEGKHLKLSNLEKVLYPEVGFTKGQVIDYYVRIAPAILPHLSHRPLTLKRYPDGVHRGHFYEKQCPRHKPQWVATQKIHSASRKRDINYCIIEDVASLVWVANLASLEMHTLLSTKEDHLQPTMVVFDLDPGAPADVLACAEVGVRLRDMLRQVGLESYIKTSGGKGLHMAVPLNSDVTFHETKAFSRVMARQLEHEAPERIVSRMSKKLRVGKVFVDWSQNDDHKTTVCAYSLRARETPTVSTPVTWQEVKRAIKKKDASLLRFEADDVLQRVQKHGDLWHDVLDKVQTLPSAAEVKKAA